MKYFLICLTLLLTGCGTPGLQAGGKEILPDTLMEFDYPTLREIVPVDDSCEAQANWLAEHENCSEFKFYNVQKYLDVACNSRYKGELLEQCLTAAIDALSDHIANSFENKYNFYYQYCLEKGEVFRTFKFLHVNVGANLMHEAEKNEC